MAEILTPTMIIAAAGFLQNTGLAVASSFTTALNTYKNDPIVSAISGINGPITGLDPDITSALGNISQLGFIASPETIASIESVATAPFSNGVMGFASVFGRAQSFASASYQLNGSLLNASQMSFADTGFQCGSFSDMITGGYAKAMGSIASTGTLLEKLGSAVTPETLKQLGSAGGLIEGLVAKGAEDIGNIKSKLLDAGVDMNDLSNSKYTKQIEGVLKSVSGTDLKKIVGEMGISPNLDIANLGDLLDVKKIMGGGFSASGLPDLSSIGTGLSNIGGSFKDASKISAFLGKIEVPSFPRLDALKTPLPDDVKAFITPYLGVGSGTFGNPTQMDIIGSCTGHVHNDGFATMKRALDELRQSPAVTALLSVASSLKTQLDAFALGGPQPDLSLAQQVASTVTSVVSSGNTALSAVLASGNAALATMTAHVETESFNLAQAGMTGSGAGSTSFDANTSTAAMQAGTMFASRMHEFGVDRQSLGLGKMMEDLAVDNLYGDAVKACMIEGRNIAAMRGVGVKPSMYTSPEKVS